MFEEINNGHGSSLRIKHFHTGNKENKLIESWKLSTPLTSIPTVPKW